MINDDCIMFVLCRMFELVVMVVEVRWVMVIIVWFNCLMFDDVVDVCVLFGELIGMQVDDGFVLILLFYVIGGIGMKFGCNVFVNQNCMFYDLGGFEIGDDVMIGLNVSLIMFGYLVEFLWWCDGVVVKLIVIECNVWIGVGVMIIGGVMIGENVIVVVVVVVIWDVLLNMLVGGNLVKVIWLIVE